MRLLTATSITARVGARTARTLFTILLVALLMPSAMAVHAQDGGGAPQDPEQPVPVQEPGATGVDTRTGRTSYVQDQSRPVLIHPATQTFPAVDGRRVVWQDDRTGPADIFLADLDTGEIRNLTNSPQWEAEPDISGDFVVWRDGLQGIGIHGLKLSSGEVFTVTVGHTFVSQPRVSGNAVIWAEYRISGDEGDIFGYDLTSGHEFVIDASPGRQQDPQFDWPYVVWWDYKERIFLHDLRNKTTSLIHPSPGARFPTVSAADNLVVWMEYVDGKWDLYGFDMATGQTRALVTDAGDQEQPVLGPGLLAYRTRHNGNQLDIYAHVLATGQSFAITDDSSLQTYPVVGDKVVLWEDTRQHQRDIFRFDWDGTIPPTITYPLAAPANLGVGSGPANRLFLRWTETEASETGYAVERSFGFATADWQPLVMLPPNSIAYTDTTVAPNASYWYRVRAVGAAGHSAWSNESFSSAISGEPNLDEQYMMVLINEARADPGAFGYPTAAPAPPLAYNSVVEYTAAAQSRSILNADAQFGHCDLANRCPGDRAYENGYPNRSCGENLVLASVGYAAVERANQSFMNSPGHRLAMLEPGFTEFGVGHQAQAHSTPIIRGAAQVTEYFCTRPGVARPVAPMGAVIPYSAGLSAVFTYTVNFYAPGQAPTVAQVFIDGKPRPLALSTGRPDHGTYRYVTRLLDAGSHRYYFWFEYGAGQTARWPVDGEVALPEIVTPPEFVPIRVPSAEIGKPYQLDVAVIAEPAPVFSLIWSSPGMVIDAKTGRFTWTPPAGGYYVAGVLASNGAEPAAVQMLMIEVAEAPRFVTTPLRSALVGQPYASYFEVSGTPYPLRVLMQAPAGMEVDPFFGELRWTPDAVGDYPIIIEANNGIEPAARHAFTLTVTPAAGFLPLVGK